MAYQIIYGEPDRFPKGNGFRTGKMVLISLVTGILFLMAAYRVWPEGAQVMDAVLTYDGWTCTGAALETMVGLLQSGTSLREAVSVFCRELVQQGMEFAA